MKQTLEQWVGTSRILAIVFTDIVDSTSLGRALGDEHWIDVLRKHVSKARSLMNPDNCYEIKMIGDSFMVAFRSAIDALDFALAFHRDTGVDLLRIRVGIHVGPVRVFENDLFGMMINYTKRIESTRNPDLIVISDDAKRHVDYEKASRHSELHFNPREIAFKGFSEPQKVWHVLDPGMMQLLRLKQTKSKKLISEPSPAVEVFKKIMFG
ncbi:MAG TPA: adenylate/guanylate cyclase domain-containing protein [Pyrinomonadaceae bacterium]|jgi:class 3 adenylate cyclase|nr:adenylate/guanylate cyclase domain-containing protein [Pyrinomonadaceae bacterium]